VFLYLNAFDDTEGIDFFVLSSSNYLQVQ